MDENCGKSEKKGKEKKTSKKLIGQNQVIKWMA